MRAFSGPGGLNRKGASGCSFVWPFSAQHQFATLNVPCAHLNIWPGDGLRAEGATGSQKAGAKNSVNPSVFAWFE